VMQAAGFYNRTTVNEVKNVISDAGFAPAQRTTEYDVLEVFDNHQSDESSKAPLTIVSG
jgi:2-iminoacetate synthase ThiH